MGQRFGRGFGRPLPEQARRSPRRPCKAGPRPHVDRGVAGADRGPESRDPPRRGAYEACAGPSFSRRTALQAIIWGKAGTGPLIAASLRMTFFIKARWLFRGRGVIVSMPSFARELEQTLHNALGEASKRRHEYATLEHLLIALIDDEHASKVMTACGVSRDELRASVKQYLDNELGAL